MAIPKFTAKDPEEIYTLGFDYSAVVLEGETISSATMAVDLHSGTADPDMGSMLMNALTIDTANHVVAQQLRNGVAGNVYRVDCLATTTDGNKYMLQGTLAVTEKNP